MKALGLIEKIKNDENKNVFRWIGSQGFSLEKKHSAKFQSQPSHLEDHKETQNEENKGEKGASKGDRSGMLSNVLAPILKKEVKSMHSNTSFILFKE
jgi:hypothetical protein